MYVKDENGEYIKINRKDYTNLYNKFRKTARWYNGVRGVWNNKTPDSFKEPWGPGWGGWAIYMHSTVPVSVRYKKEEDYVAEPDQQQDIPSESSYVHTLGNENYIRDYVKSLNDKVRTCFGETEYSSTEDYYTNDVVSYKVDFIKKSEEGEVISTTTYYTSSYENNNPNASITLFFNKDLTGSSINYYVKNFNVEVTENGSRVQKSNVSPNMLESYLEDGTSKPLILSYNKLEWSGDRGIKKVSRGKKALNQPFEKGVESGPLPPDVDNPMKYSETSVYYEGKPVVANPSETSSVEYSTFENFNGSNQEAVYTKNVNVNYKLKNEDVVRKEDINQIDRLLNKIQHVLEKKDGYFDSNGRCNYSCQVNCQKRCQLSCQGCNWSQCHNQSCGSI